MPDTRDRTLASGSDHVQAARRLFPVPVEPPLVSIIVTAHNYGRFVADCLNSVFAQTHPRIECIVVDDCSDDDTPAVVEGLLAGWNDPRFSYHRLSRNVGQLGAQVEGFARSKGEFVVFLDADDLLFPDFVARHLFVHHNLETPVGFTSSNQWTIARGRPVAGQAPHRPGEPAVFGRGCRGPGRRDWRRCGRRRSAGRRPAVPVLDER